MLDWIGPAVAMIGNEQAFRVTAHSAEEVAGWASADLKRPVLTPLQEKLAHLKPLSPAPPANVLATQIVESVTSPYPHPQAAQLEAARSVTDWTKQGRAAPAGYASQVDQTITFERTLAVPRCLMAADDLSAADIGSATHTVLQHLDFARACSGADLAEQIQSLVERRLLTAVQAKRVDQAAIEWFIGSDLGKHLCKNLARLRRELDFYLAVPPEEFPAGAPSTDPLDQVMIRGRIDALLITPTELTLIDYKTDRLTPEKVPQRAEFYAPQVALYRRAMERIAGRAVSQVHLVFLSARRIVTA
jgi:ATP-dependent helicase/nuclease subunit A